MKVPTMIRRSITVASDWSREAMNSRFDFLRLNRQLEERREQHILRSCVCVDARTDSQISIGGREYVNFCSNDYLGLSGDPHLVEAWREGIRLWGCGSGASPLVTGLTRAHRDLQDEICDWLGVEDAILFNSGFAANQAVVKALNSKNTVIYADRLAHASLQEASVLSGARYVRFLHNDPASLESKISPQSGMIITEGVFSMDGDQAPLNRLYDIAQRSGNILFVDDAHGFGVHGSEGRGTVDLQGLRHRDIDVIMGTFGKALGTSGAFVAGSKDFIDYMINFSREYVYSTHMAPSVAYATLQAVKIVRSGEHLRRKLGENLRYFKRALEQLSLTASQSVTSIQPIVTGSSEKALQWSREFVNHGCYVSAIRHPTVPKNTARLRITITAGHSFEQIDKLTEGLFACLQLR